MTIKQKIGQFLIPKLPIARDLFSVIRFELNSFLLRMFTRVNIFKILKIRKIQQQPNLRLNVGAGPFGEDEWINIDVVRMRNITFTYDCREKLPFKSSTVCKIRCEHFFEHLYFTDEATRFIRESYRVLKPGGCLRLIVPDGEKVIKAYMANDWDELGLNPAIWPTPMHAVNHIFHQNGEHKFCYDFITIENLTKTTGFSRIIKQEYRHSVDPELCNDRENHKRHSLYVDCIK